MAGDHAQNGCLAAAGGAEQAAIAAVVDGETDIGDGRGVAEAFGDFHQVDAAVGLRAGRGGVHTLVSGRVRWNRRAKPGGGVG